MRVLSKKRPQLNKKQAEGIFYISLMMLSLFAFLFLGADGYVLFDDSGTYINFMQLKSAEGVMPLYPLFLFFNKIIWGAEHYLQAVVIEQTLVATICVICFVREIKKRFGLSYKESYLVYFLALVPFTTDFPATMVTQEILTEGLTYALFYLLVVLLLGAIWDRSFGKLAGAFCFLFVLALLRSQLQILFAVCGVIAVYLIWVKYSRKKKLLLVLRTLASLVLCILLMGVGVLGVVKINSACQKAMFGDGGFAQFIAEHSQDEMIVVGDAGEADTAKNTEIESTAIESNAEVESAVEEVTSKVPENAQTGTDVQEEQADKPAPNTAPEVVEFLSKGYEDSGASVSQYSSIIFCKGMYEADYEDYLLFEDEEVQKQFLHVYEIVDELKYRYPYAESGLWGWQHISNSLGGMGKHCFDGLNKYFADYYNTTIVYFQYQCTAQAFSTIGMKLLLDNFGSFVVHTIQLMIPSFIFTVFFQKAEFYLLCHLITLFLYVTAIGMTIWCFLNKKANKKCAEFMLFVLVNNVIMVTAISLVFIGLQRYLVYAFGIFYVAYYLLVKELWQCYGQVLISKFRGKMR